MDAMRAPNECTRFRPAYRSWPAYLLLALAACQSTPVPVSSNQDLIDSVHESVPADWRHAASQLSVDDPLAVSPELEAFVRSRTSGKQRPRERVLAIARAIFEPDGVGLTYDEGATHTAEQTFVTGLGNCMGFSNLMVAATRAAGLRANFELMSDYANWQQQGDLLVRTMHVRVVSRTRDQRMIFDFYPDPVSPGAWSRQLSDDEARAHHFNNLAAEFLQDGDYPRAYAYLYKALAISPNASFLWSNLGALLSRQGRVYLAEAAYREATRLDPGQLTAVSNLQRLYQRTGRDKEAAALESQVAKYRDRNPFYHFWQAEQAYADGDYPLAEEHYRRAIKLKNDEREFHVGLARTYYKQGKVLAARKAINKSHQLFSSEADTITVRPRRR